MFDLFLKIFLFLSPILWLPYNGLAQRFQWFQFGYFTQSGNVLQLQFFQYGTIFLFLVSLFEKPKRLFCDKFFGLLFFMCVLSVYWHPKTIITFFTVFTGFLLYYLVVSYVKKPYSVLKVVVFVSLLNTIFSILQFFGINLIYAKNPEIIGLMSYKTQLGIYQGVALPVCYVFHPALSIIPLVGLLLSKSFTAVIPAAIGMLYLFRKKLFYLKSMPFLILVLSCFVFFIPRIFYKLSLRFNVWEYTFKETLGKFIKGHGIGTFKYSEPLITNLNIKYTDPYNLYLQTAYFLGIFGLIALVLFIGTKLNFCPSGLLNGLYAACIVLVLSGMGYSFMDYPRLAGTTVVLFGLLTVQKEKLCL